MTTTPPLHDTLTTWRPAMLRFARLHIQPQEDAEDAVQDALLAAVAGAPHASDLADPRPYLFGILRHKIADRLRQRYRHGTPQDPIDDAPDQLDDTLFDPRGHWAVGMAPGRWHTPDAHLANAQFFAVVDACIEGLPTKAARVFSMKELLDCEANEVCSLLGITQNDYWQCMSRARKRLQLCLDQRWFTERAA